MQLVTYANLSVGTQEVDLFEAYWSPWPKGKVSVTQVFRFLLRAGWSGLYTYFVHAGKFNRYLFGTSRVFHIPVLTPVVLAWLLAVLLSLIVVISAYACVGVGYGLMFGGARIFDQCVLRDLRTWLYFSGTLSAILLLFFGLISKVPARPPRSMMKGWFLYFLLFLLTVIQMWTAVMLGFSLRSHWTGHELRPSPVCSPSTCDDILDHRLLTVLDFTGFTGVFYPKGHDLNIQWLLLTAATLIVAVLYLVLPKLLTYFLGDLVAYLVASRANEFYSLREEIRRRCYQLCRTVFDRVGANGKKHYEKVVVVSHSLGTVIAYDTVNRILAEDRERNSPEPASDQLRGFVTLGSPLDKAAFLFGYDSQQVSDLRTKLVSCTQPLISEPELRLKVQWVNFWSRLDPVSASIDYYDKENGEESAVINVHDDESSVPIAAHGEYWKHGGVKEILQAMCQPREFSLAQVRELGSKLAGK